MKTLSVAVVLAALAASRVFPQKKPEPGGGAGKRPCPNLETAPLGKPFSQQKWLKAPNSSPDWSREDMELPNIKGWPRQKVIALLGKPGMTEQVISPHQDENT